MGIKDMGEPRIVKLNVDFGKEISKGEKLSVQFTGGAIVPKEESNNECFASMTLLIKTASDKVIFLLMVQCKVLCFVEKNEKDTREDLIKKEVFPKLIDWISDFYNDMGEKTVLKLPNFPVIK